MVVDANKNEVIVAGLVSKNNGSSYYHRIMKAPLDGGCGPFTKLGSFGDGDYEPMAHGSEIDAENNRMFITLAPSARSYSMGVVSYPSGKLKSLPMTNTDNIWGPVLSDNKLFGIASDGTGLAWRSLDPDAGDWTSEGLKMAEGATIKFDQLWGNLGSVRAHNHLTHELYVLIGRQNSDTIHCKWKINPPDRPAPFSVSSIFILNFDEICDVYIVAAINMKAGRLTSASPPALSGDTGFSGEILMNLAICF